MVRKRAGKEYESKNERGKHWRVKDLAGNNHGKKTGGEKTGGEKTGGEKSIGERTGHP